MVATGQALATGTQAPALQMPAPALHELVLFTWVQPSPGAVGLHASFVQGLLSLQVFTLPLVQTPDWHVSPTVQTFPSLQLPVSNWQVSEQQSPGI
jgi:hypothetical protein